MSVCSGARSCIVGVDAAIALPLSGTALALAMIETVTVGAVVSVHGSADAMLPWRIFQSHAVNSKRLPGKRYAKPDLSSLRR
jgi:hypothetical protein